MSTNALILSRDNGLEFDRFNSFNVTIMPMTCKDLEIDAVSFNDIDGNKYTGLQYLCADIDCHSPFGCIRCKLDSPRRHKRQDCG